MQNMALSNQLIPMLMNGYMIMLYNNAQFLTFGPEPTNEELDAIEQEGIDDQELDLES